MQNDTAVYPAHTFNRRTGELAWQGNATLEAIAKRGLRGRFGPGALLPEGNTR
jgi:hypothetical protein